MPNVEYYQGRNDLEEIVNGLIYGDGGVQTDLNEAMKVLTVGLKNGEPWVYPIIGEIYINYEVGTDQYNLGIEFLQKGHSLGDLKCTSLLACKIFQVCPEGHQDEEIAVILLELAAKNGSANAISVLARNREYIKQRYDVDIPIPDEKYTNDYIVYCNVMQNRSMSVEKIHCFKFEQKKSGKPEILMENRTWVGSYNHLPPIPSIFPNSRTVERDISKILNVPNINIDLISIN